MGAGVSAGPHCPSLDCRRRVAKPSSLGCQVPVKPAPPVPKSRSGEPGATLFGAPRGRGRALPDWGRRAEARPVPVRIARRGKPRFAHPGSKEAKPPSHPSARDEAHPILRLHPDRGEPAILPPVGGKAEALPIPVAGFHFRPRPSAPSDPASRGQARLPPAGRARGRFPSSRRFGSALALRRPALPERFREIPPRIRFRLCGPGFVRRPWPSVVAKIRFRSPAAPIRPQQEGLTPRRFGQAESACG
jgi:hypothetical protein